MNLQAFLGWGMFPLSLDAARDPCRHKQTEAPDFEACTFLAWPVLAFSMASEGGMGLPAVSVQYLHKLGRHGLVC